MSPSQGSTPRLTDWLTDSRNELDVRQSPVGKNVGTKTKDIVGIRQEATTGEDIADWEDYVCCAYSDLWSV
jgi:hypothetical protein